MALNLPEDFKQTDEGLALTSYLTDETKKANEKLLADARTSTDPKVRESVAKFDLLFNLRRQLIK